MKTLFLLRHAKAQPDAPAGDHARMLTERGRRNAAAMGDYLHGTAGIPATIITSDATRARHTAHIVAEVVGFTAPLILDPRLYDADGETLLAVVRSLPDDADAALVVGHNPGFEELAEALAGSHDERIRLPTSGLAVLAFDVDRWDAVRHGAGRLRGVATPRTIG